MNAAPQSFAPAYDVSALAAPKVKQPPELRVLHNDQHKQAMLNRGRAVRGVLLFALVMLVFSVIVYNNMVLTELNEELATARREYEQLMDENGRMQVELEGKMSLRNIEQYAAEQMGMSKMEAYQIQYVDLGGDNKCEVLIPQKQGFWQQINNWICSVLEYIG